MALENARKFLEELDSNEKALEILKAHETADEDQEAAILASAARETGYDVSDEEMKKVFTAARTHVIQSGDKAAADVEISPEDLDKVAGGEEHFGCSDTFTDGENCALNDSCNKVLLHYLKKNKKTNEVECVDNSYTACNDGLMTRPDCKLGRLGF